MGRACAVCLMTIAALSAACATGVEEGSSPEPAGAGGTSATGGSGGGAGGTAGVAGSGAVGGQAGATMDAAAGSGGVPDAADDQGAAGDGQADGPPDGGMDATMDASADVAVDAALDAPLDATQEASADAPADVVADVIDGAADAGLETGVDAEAGVVANEACPGEVLQLAGSGGSARTATVQATTQGLKNDTSGSCGGTGYADAVYAFTPDVSGVLTLSVTTSGYDAALYLRTNCTSTASQVACKDSAGSTGTESIVTWVTAGTTYYAFVDGATSTKGAFTLDVRVEPEAPSEQCPGETVAWIGSGTQDRTTSVSGNTNDRWNDYDGSCSSSSTPDAVYAFPADVTGQMKLSLSTPGWDGALYVRSNCTSAASETACKDLLGSSGAETAQFWVTAGSTWWVFVDGSLSSSKGPYTLTGTLSPEVPAETCPGEPAVWSGSGADPRTFAATGDTSLRWHDASGSCGASAANDAVYAVTPDVDGILTLEVTPSGWDTAMYVRTTCTSSSSEVVCRDQSGSGSKETYTLWALAGTTYYVFVDGYTNTSKGPYTFQATLLPQLASEKCDGETLVFSGSPPAVTANGNTSSMWSDYAGTCGGSAAKDAVYHVVAPQSGTMTVTLTPSGWDPVLYVRSGSCTGTQVSCSDQTGSGSAETATVAATAGTDYYLFVDGYSSGAGAYSLSVHF